MLALVASRLDQQRHVLTSRNKHPPCFFCAVGEFGKTFGKEDLLELGVDLKKGQKWGSNPSPR